MSVSPEVNLTFKSKVDELVEWGLENGIKIDAYLNITIDGVFPYISYTVLSPEDRAKYEEHKKIMVEAMKVEKATHKQ